MNPFNQDARILIKTLMTLRSAAVVIYSELDVKLVIYRELRGALPKKTPAKASLGIQKLNILP